MKNVMKLLALALAVLMALSGAFAEERLGAWNATADASVTMEARAALETALEGFVGSRIEPVALLATQVVSGMNYCLLCRVTPVAPNAAPQYATVYVYQKPDGSAEITAIEDIEIGPNLSPAFDEADGEDTALRTPDITFLLTCAVEGMEEETGLTLRQHANGDTEMEIYLNLGNGVQRWEAFVPSSNIKQTEEEWTLVYSDCVYSVTPASAQGPEDTQILYTDGTGKITMRQDGHYIWTDDKDQAGQGLDFVSDGTVYAITEYQDAVSQRASMRLWSALSADNPDGKQHITAEITWADSAFETREWRMSFEAPLVMTLDEPIPLAYADCICHKIIWTDEGEKREMIYESGTGRMIAQMDESGAISYTWISDNDTFENNCVFYPLYIG